MSIDSDVIRGHVDTIILKTLITGDKYGYEIIKEIEQKSKGTYELKQPTLYSCLKRLESQGLISGFTKNSDIGGKRRYYKLTKKGREAYENSMQDWFNSRSIIDSLMGSKPTNLTLAEDDEDLPIISEEFKMLDESLEQEFKTPEEGLAEARQITLDGDTKAIESEPLDFDNENLDDDDVQLLGDYYKTDENQINLFEGNDEPHWTEKVLHPEESDYDSTPPQETDKDEFMANLFKNYDGTDVNKYKQNSKDNYFESISYGIADEDNVDVTEEEMAPDEETEEPVVVKDEKSPFSSFSFFTSYPDEEEKENDDDYSLSNEDDENETLNFGFNYNNDETDDMNLPRSFMDVSDIDEAEPEEHPHISIFGEEEPEEDENNYTDPQPSYYSETVVNVYDNQNPSDLRPYNIGNYTEPEYKEKLNQLSSYTKSNYETKPTGYAVDHMTIEARSITELKEDLGQAGISVRAYARPEKEALKDKKYLLVNKIKFVTSWITFAIMAVLLTATFFIAKAVGYTNLMNVETALPAYVYFILAGLATLAVPATYTIIFLLNKTKKIKPNYSAMISFVFALLFFIVCLNIIYTLNILNGFTKFTQIDYNHLLWLLPSVVSLLILFQSVVYSILFKSKKFNA